jgi:CheY-like chemotaxis protein
LVAEDDPNDTLLLTRAFAKAGLAIPLDFVCDGQEAVDYLGRAQAKEHSRETIPQLLLLDLKMPRMDGFDVLKWLRAQPGLQRLPVIVFSSSGQQEDIDSAYGLGANSYLVKPQTLERLQDLVRTIHQYWTEWNTTEERAS